MSRFGIEHHGKKLVISARPLLMTYPTGCCIKELAIKIQIAEIFAAIATSQIAAACSLLE